MDFISQPWAWYVSGPAIAFVMFLLMWMGERFGVSTTMKTLCAIGGAGKYISFFDYDWKTQLWSLAFVGGTVIGGFIAANFLTAPGAVVAISPETVGDLQALGVSHDAAFAPLQIFSLEGLLSLKGAIIMVAGGFLIGFGTRYAGGCTSGHAISGLSNFQLPSLVAVIGFFAGGLLMTYVLLPLIMKL